MCQMPKGSQRTVQDVREVPNAEPDKSKEV